MSDQVRRWRCRGCGVPVSSNCTGQVRDEQGRHHNVGEACISVLRGDLTSFATAYRTMRQKFGTDPYGTFSECDALAEQHDKREAVIAASQRGEGVVTG